jgi:hypothetical protein
MAGEMAERARGFSRDQPERWPTGHPEQSGRAGREREARPDQSASHPITSEVCEVERKLRGAGETVGKPALPMNP